MTCPKCKGDITISDPSYCDGFGWFAGAICWRCNHLFAEVWMMPTKEDAEKKLLEKLQKV